MNNSQQIDLFNQKGHNDSIQTFNKSQEASTMVNSTVELLNQQQFTSIDGVENIKIWFDFNS